MKIKATTPYVYLIGWQQDDCDLDAYYIGYQQAEGCHPDNLWKTYFTSSGKVEKHAEEYGDPNLIMILEKYETCHDRETLDRVGLHASQREDEYQREFRVLEDGLYLNGNIQGVAFKHDAEWRAKNKAAMQRREKDPAYQKQRKAMFESEEYQANHKAAMQKQAEDPEWRANQKAGAKKRAQCPEWRANNKAANRMRAQSSEYRAKLSAAKTGSFFWNNGTINKRSKTQPGPEWVRGRLKKPKSH